MVKQTYSASPSAEQQELIRNLGGPAKVARMLSARIVETVRPTTVANWNARGIPFRYRAPLAIEARERGVSVPDNFLGEGPEVFHMEQPATPAT